MAVTLNASTSTGLVQSADTSGEIELQSNGTTALKVNTNEGIQILNCLGVGNATPSTSGAGITFPATQSASTDANTLDDYEEGTWTPVATSSTGSITAYTSAGFYTKVGRLVNLTCSVTITTAGTAGGNLDLSGVPFTNANTFQISVLCKELDITGSGNFMAFLLNANTIIRIQAIGGTAPTWGNGYKYAFTLTYIV